jgi:transmembrane sensor
VLKIAAAVVVTAAVSVGGSLLALHQENQTFATTIGGREALSLVDGSKIELNTDTVLRMAEGSSQRKVWLDKGEAYFDIKHDAAHPFVVMVGSHRITDLGTKFIVRQDGDRVEVKLLEGSARLDANDGARSQTAVLKPGDVAIATADAMSVTKKPLKELANELGWRRGVLMFDHTTLAEAVVEFNRYNRQKIVIADPQIARLEIGGTFPSDDVKLFGRAAHIALGLHVEERNNTVIISQ